jgi:hypothetical protein
MPRSPRDTSLLVMAVARNAAACLACNVRVGAIAELPSAVASYSPATTWLRGRATVASCSSGVGRRQPGNGTHSPRVARRAASTSSPKANIDVSASRANEANDSGANASASLSRSLGAVR